LVLFTIVGLISLEVLGQASVKGVKICAISCSDGSTYAKCCDMSGAAQSGDCYYAGSPLFGDLHCPSPLQPVSYIYDFGANREWEFLTLEDCQSVFDSISKKPNLPVIVKDSVKPVIDSRTYSNPIKEAMEWHPEFSMYTDKEQLMLGHRIINANKKTRQISYSDEDVREIAHYMHDYVKRVNEKTNKTGIYSNSKCAGCSLILQNLEERVGSAICDHLSGTITGAICGSNPVFQPFCEAIASSSGVEEIIQSLCLDVFNGVVGGTGLRERANYVCSALTCTSQPSQITSENDIMGSCKTVGSSENDKRSFNERCDELIRICDMAEKGLCISDALDEIKEVVDGGIIKAGVDTIFSIVNGEKLPVEESAQKLAFECSKVTCGGIDYGSGDNNDSNSDADGSNQFNSASIETPILALTVFVLCILSVFNQF